MKEETPSLRSIAIGAPTGVLPLHRIAPVGKLPSRPLHRPQAASASLSWTVDSILPAISADYMLERTNVYISSSSSQAVADRIVESLSRQSIAYQESDERKNSLLGESHNGVRFYLNLFAAPDDSSIVIVEVQRLTGCAFEFRGICRDVCRSAKGLGGGPPSMGKRKFPMPCGLPRVSSAEKETRLRSEVDRALDMIQGDMVDSHLLGIDLLEGASTSPLASPLVLKEECLLKLRGLILLEEDDHPSQVEAKRACQMKRKALAVIANGLSNSAPDFLAESLHAPIFVEELFLLTTGKDPHCAAQAARCLQSLAASCQTTKSFLLASLGVSSVLSSIEVKHHLSLEKECGKLQTTLMC